MSFMHDVVSQKSEITHKMLGAEFSPHLEQLRLATQQLFPQPCLQPLLTPDGFQGGNSIALKKGLKKGPKKGLKVNLLQAYV